MKRSLYIFAALFLAASCVMEEKDNSSLLGGEPVTFSATIQQSRTQLGEPEGNVWPNLWSVGDAISVNGVTSAPLTAKEAGGSSASFTVEGVSAPYEAVYPAGATEIPAFQTYVEGSYDPAAFLMRASSETENLAFEAQAAIFKFTPTGEGDVRIASVSVNGYKMTAPEGVELGKPWFISIAPGDYSQDGIQVLVTDTDGGAMSRRAIPGKAYEAGRMYSASLAYDADPEFANVTGTVTCAGQGVEGVLLSDGIHFTQTDAKGRYSFHSEKKWKYVFMVLPSGYEVPLEGVLPQIWKPISGDVMTMDNVDFELIQAPNDDYTLLLFGDMHLARRNGDLAQFEQVAGFINKTIANLAGKVYVLTLGDMTWDMYWIANNYGFGDYLQTVNSYFSGIPFFHTMGNHDNEMEVAGDYLKALRYTQNLAPDYYSFNLGKMHYIVLDNMDFTGVEAGEENRSKYAKNFTAEQLDWLRQDLSYVDKSTPIFVTAHEPLARPSGLSWGEELNGKDADLDDFIGIFDGYNVRYLSGHTHNTFHRTYAPDFVEHNSGAICASWWWSGKINPGIHIAQDGAPGGFTVWDVKGTNCTHYYQAALQKQSYQFRAYDMNSVKATITADLSDHSGYPKYYNHIQSYGSNVILVNVWDYDDDWKVEISENGNPLNVSEVGVYDPLHIYAMTIPRLNDYNTTTFSTAKWRHFFQATASAANTPVTVKVTDRYGRVYTEEMTRPKAFTIDEYKNEFDYVRPAAEFVTATSSSLIFGWTVGGTAAEDGSLPYKLALYRDAACTDLLVSFDVPAGHSCWSGNSLRYAFGGLEPGTSYWFVVTNTKNGDVSDPVQGTTEDFTVVVPSTVSNPKPGTVLLAEDFSEMGWGPDYDATAAGFYPSEKLLEPVTGTEHAGSFIDYNSTARRLYGDTKVTSDKRLFGWGFFGNSSVYAGNGYVRVGTTQTETARTHIVTPALSGIPEGKTATVDVTVTCCMVDKNNDVAIFVNDRSSLKLVLAPDQKENSNFSGKGGKYEGASLTNGVALDVPYRELTTKTVRLEGLNSSSCLLIGSLNHVSKKNRFLLSDVKVTLVSIDEIPDISASLGNATSSSLSFTWTEGISASDDVSKPYTIALYKDEACTDLYVSHNVPAGHSCWNKKQPRFVFGGLDQDTDYWFKVTDTTEGDEKVSNVVKATTLPFARVDASQVKNAAVGDIILGEDFSEVHYGPDEFDNAAGFMPSPHTLEPIVGEDPDGTFEIYNSTGTRLWGNNFKITEGTRMSHGWGFYGNSAVYSRVGYFRCATTSLNSNGTGSRTHIVTPRLAGIPDGYAATIEVTVTDRMYETNGDVGVFVCSNLTMNSTTDTSSSSFGKYTGSGALDNGYALGISTGSWQTKSVTIDGVTNRDQLLIGSLEDVIVSGKSKNRHNFSDITVKIVDLYDASRNTRVSVIGDSISTYAGWCDTTKGGAYYPRTDCDVDSVEKTWWYRLIYNYMSTGRFEKNISAGNTTIVQNSTGDSSAYWYGWDFGTRLQTLGLGNPDVVLVFGGTNDYGHTLYNSTSEELIEGVPMGSKTFPESAEDDLEELFLVADEATTVAQANALDGSTYCGACIRLIRMLQTRYPSVKIVWVIGDYVYSGMAEANRRIAAHFGDDQVRTVDIFGKYGYQASAIPKFNYAHPTAAGMEVIASYAWQQVGSWIDE